MYSLAIFANMHNTASGVLNLYGRFDLLSTQQVAGPIVRLIGASIAWWSHGGLKAYLIAWLLGSITEGLIDWFMVIGEMRRRGVLTGAMRWPAGITKEHPGIWKFLLANNVDLSLTDAVNRITPLAVGAVLNPAAVGLYHLALRIGMVLQQPIIALGRTVYPELAALAARGERQVLQRLVLRTGLIAMGGGLLAMLIFVVFGDNILLAIGGPGFEGAYRILLLIAFARTIHLFGFPFSSALVALGKPYVTLRISLAGVVLLTPVLYLLLLRFDVIGAGLHAIAYAVTTVGAMAWALMRKRRETQVAA
jgi:O-antigen/teichoic acid export membrane protein